MSQQIGNIRKVNYGKQQQMEKLEFKSIIMNKDILSEILIAQCRWQMLVNLRADNL